MLKGFKVVALGALVVCAYVQPAMARDFAEIYTDCGLGAMISPKNDAVAAITNVTWDWGTTAISSNISSPDSCMGGKQRMAALIYESYESLEADLASGSGTYLDALTSLSGYDAQGQQQLAAALRSDFATIVANPGYTNQTRFQKSEALYNALSKYVGAQS